MKVRELIALLQLRPQDDDVIATKMWWGPTAAWICTVSPASG
jgi:hypothetical protein